MERSIGRLLDVRGGAAQRRVHLTLSCALAYCVRRRFHLPVCFASAPLWICNPRSAIRGSAICRETLWLDLDPPNAASVAANLRPIKSACALASQRLLALPAEPQIKVLSVRRNGPFEPNKQANSHCASSAAAAYFGLPSARDARR